MTDPAQLADLAINQPDVALIFEGGGMRNSLHGAHGGGAARAQPELRVRLRCLGRIPPTR